jgi:lipopolysaccharide biosynthesis regulator YciM
MLKTDTRRAISLLRDVVKQDSDHIDAYLQLGNILRDEEPQRALKIHQTLTVRPNLNKTTKVDIYKSLAMDYEVIGDLIKARKEAEQILIIDKLNKWAITFLLNIGEKLEDWDYATDKAKQLQKIIGVSDSNNLAKYIVYKSKEKIKQNNFKEAESLLDKAISQSPEFGLPYKYLGDIKMKNRDLVKAIEYWEKFINLSPEESYMVFDSMESALFDLGRYSEVENFYRKVLEKTPMDLAAGLRLANVLNEKGEDQAAILLIDKLIDNGNATISIMLMKLKLSLFIKTPAELGYQVDEILNQLENINE